MGLTVEGAVFSLDPLDGRCWCQDDVLITFMLNHLYESAKLGFTVKMSTSLFLCICIWTWFTKNYIEKSEAVDHYFCKNRNSNVVLTPLACTGVEGCRKYVRLHTLCYEFTQTKQHFLRKSVWQNAAVYVSQQLIKCSLSVCRYW